MQSSTQKTMYYFKKHIYTKNTNGKGGIYTNFRRVDGSGMEKKEWNCKEVKGDFNYTGGSNNGRD